jgi:phosphatidylserine decarboxylase
MEMFDIKHQFVDRETGRIRDEELFGDQALRLVYSSVREKAPVLFNCLTGRRMSKLLSWMNYDNPLDRFCRRSFGNGIIDFSECVEPESFYNTPRKVFQRQIRYWECRPMPLSLSHVVSPADSRVILGSLNEVSALFLKEKFFNLEELLGRDKTEWMAVFDGGDFAVFRLTPEKYHYNHTPVAGEVVDFYEISGAYHSCNPGAIIALGTPCSRNKRVVTIVNTNVPGGTGVGMVAMIEIVALMIGDIVQAYSTRGYDNPQPITKGMFLEKGVPKSLYRPGSSTDIVLFQEGRIRFAGDIVRNQQRHDAKSRFSFGFGRTVVETDLRVRSLIGTDTRRSNVGLDF